MYSKINASCEHSCSLCAAKHAGIITHCIQRMVYFLQPNAKYRQIYHTWILWVLESSKSSQVFSKKSLRFAVPLQVLVSGWTKSLAPPILMPSPCTGTARERNCTMAPWWFPSRKATKFCWLVLCIWFFVFVFNYPWPKIDDFHSVPQIDWDNTSISREMHESMDSTFVVRASAAEIETTRRMLEHTDIHCAGFIVHLYILPSIHPSIHPSVHPSNHGWTYTRSLAQHAHLLACLLAFLLACLLASQHFPKPI